MRKNCHGEFWVTRFENYYAAPLRKWRLPKEPFLPSAILMELFARQASAKAKVN